MELQGKCIKVLGSQGFASKKNGKRYVRSSFVISDLSGNYPKRAVFSVVEEEGAGKFASWGVVEDGVYAVSFDIDAREFGGKWYNDVVAWKVQRLDEQGGLQPQQQQYQQPQSGATDVPF